MAMTISTRRDFLKTSAAAAAGATLGRTRGPAQTGTIQLTIKGLCAIVKSADGVDVVLPKAPGHLPRFTYPGKTEAIQGCALTLSGLPAGAVDVDREAPCDIEHRWFANLSRLYPKQPLVNYRTTDQPDKVTSFLPLTGGAIRMVVSDPAAVPGIHGVWKLSWTGESTQVLVEVVQYQAAVAPGTLTLTLRPMKGGKPRSVPLEVSANQTLNLVISNETKPMPRNRVGYLQHFSHYANIFEVPPATMNDPESNLWCDKSTSSPLAPPTDAVRHAAKRGSPSEIQVGSTQFKLTGDDPICPVAHYDPGAE
jgi:TAT (twin-arginine translocation) pathway signal sequence.